MDSHMQHTIYKNKTLDKQIQLNLDHSQTGGGQRTTKDKGAEGFVQKTPKELK